MKLDLNAKRAARAAARGEGMFITVDEHDIELIAELPLDFDVIRVDNTMDVVKMLLVNPEDYEVLKKAKLSLNDVLEIVEMYGVQLGESLSAAESSIKTSARSRQTGKGSTSATSRRTSGAKNHLTPVDSSA